MIACRPLKNENVKTIITFETPSGTEWIGKFRSKKISSKFIYRAF